MYQNLPSLNALRVFEAAARHLSFTLAARELFVTHGAVSKQIKQLEEYLGFPLFIRMHRRLELTPEGERYLPSVTRSLALLNSATRELMATPDTQQSLAINNPKDLQQILIRDAFPRESDHLLKETLCVTHTTFSLSSQNTQTDLADLNILLLGYAVQMVYNFSR